MLNKIKVALSASNDSDPQALSGWAFSRGFTVWINLLTVITGTVWLWNWIIPLDRETSYMLTGLSIPLAVMTILPRLPVWVLRKPE